MGDEEGIQYWLSLGSVQGDSDELNGTFNIGRNLECRGDSDELSGSD